MWDSIISTLASLTAYIMQLRYATKGILEIILQNHKHVDNTMMQRSARVVMYIDKLHDVLKAHPRMINITSN